MRDDGAVGEGPLLFMHIPKTAGTTLRAVVERQYRPAVLATLYPGHWTQFESLRERTPLPAAVMGHFRFGLHAALATGGRYVTFLRDPVDQVISHYNHLINSDATHHRSVLRSSDGLERFLDHDWARNLQTQYVTGLSACEIEADPDAAFETAVTILRRHFLFTGVVEAFDRSLQLLVRQLGWRMPGYAPMNRSSERPHHLPRVGLSSRVIESIERANVCDTRLHSFACGQIHAGSFPGGEAIRGVGRFVRRILRRLHRSDVGGDPRMRYRHEPSATPGCRL